MGDSLPSAAADTMQLTSTSMGMAHSAPLGFNHILSPQPAMKSSANDSNRQRADLCSEGNDYNCIFGLPKVEVKHSSAKRAQQEFDVLPGYDQALEMLYLLRHEDFVN